MWQIRLVLSRQEHIRPELSLLISLSAFCTILFHFLLCSLSLLLSICLSVCLPVCLSVCLPLPLPLPPPFLSF